MYLRQELLYASAFMFLNVGSHYKLTLDGMTSSILTLMSPLSDQLACDGMTSFILTLVRQHCDLIIHEYL